jgi:hypothetical protein
MLCVSSGPLRYSRLENGGFKLVLEVDPEIPRLARALIPKAVRLNQPRFAPHITVVRNEVPKRERYWGRLEGRTIYFTYSPVVCVGEVYFWLRVFCTPLNKLREELGLPHSSEWSRPPDGSECFHTTIGNTKPIGIGVPLGP